MVFMAADNSATTNLATNPTISSVTGRVDGQARGMAGRAARVLAGAFGAESPEDLNPFQCGARAAELVDVALTALAQAAGWVSPLDSSGAHSALGYRSAERFLALEAGCGPELARTLVRVSRFCERHRLTGEHLASGAIGFDRVDALARAVDSRLEDHYAEHETELLARAETARDVKAVSDLARHWRARVAPDVASEDCAAAFESRRLDLNRDLFGGVSGSFALDAVGGAIVADALDTPPDPTTGPIEARTAAQRRADALVDLAAGTTDTTDTTTEPEPEPEPEPADPETAPDPQPAPTQNTPPQNTPTGPPRPTGRRTTSISLDVLVDIATLENRPGLDLDALRAEIGSGHPISQPIIEQLICDATLRRVLTDGPSQILDIGTATPLIPTAVRRAVQIRDRHCQFAGCDVAWDRCDIHHLIPRSHHGPTNPDNLVLLCRRHHTQTHQGGWTLAKLPDGTIVTIPPDSETPGGTHWALTPDNTWTQIPAPARPAHTQAQRSPPARV